MNNAVYPPRRKSNGLFTVLVIILSLIFALNIGTLCSNVFHRAERGYTNEYSELARTARKGDFPRLVEELVYNEAKGLKTQKDSSEYQALGQFYQAAMLCHAYRAEGDEVHAAQQLERMQTLEQGMTDSEVLAAAAQLRDFYGIK